MEKTTHFIPVYDPPFYLQKVNNFEKAIYERKGHWTQKQKIKYGVFLEIFRQKFEDRQTPILNKMFRVMSDFIKTRNHNQCRSHHQKMERERFQINSILDSIKSKYHPREYELFFEKYSRHIKAVNLDAVLNQKGFTPHKNVEKRRKNQPFNAQTGLAYEDNETDGPKDNIKMSKIENVDPVYEVLNYGYNEQNFEQNRNQLNKQKQNAYENSNSSKSKIEYVPDAFVRNPNNGPEEMISQKGDKALKITDIQYDKDEKAPKLTDTGPKKDDKALKKTGVTYDSDESNEPIKNVQKQKVNIFDIPAEYQSSNFHQKLNPGHGFSLGTIQDFMNPMNQMAVPPQFQTPHLDPYRIYDNPFPPVYRMSQSELNYEENFVVNSKSLEEKKKWHLSEASRLCLQMNEHIQKSKDCEQMIEMMKKMAEPRNHYYYGNGFYNTHI